MPIKARRNSTSSCGHIASDNQIPISQTVGGVPQGSQNAAQRAFAGVEIGNHGITQRFVVAGIPTRVALPAASQTTRATDWAKAPPRNGSKALSRPHTGTAAPHQHVSRMPHSKMITLGFRAGLQFNAEAPASADVVVHGAGKLDTLPRHCTRRAATGREAYRTLHRKTEMPRQRRVAGIMDLPLRVASLSPRLCVESRGYRIRELPAKGRTF